MARKRFGGGRGRCAQRTEARPALCGLETLEQRVLLSGATGQIYVADGYQSTPYAIGQYTTAGATVNSALVSEFSPFGLSVSGSDVFLPEESGAIAEFTTSGAEVNPALIAPSGSRVWTAVSGSDMYVANHNLGTIGQYTTSGATVNATLVSGLATPSDLAVSGSDLFFITGVSNTIEEYTTSGAIVNTALVSTSGTTSLGGFAVSGSDLYVMTVDESDTGTISHYTLSGSTATLVNASLVTGLSQAERIFLSGSNLLVVGGAGIGEYTTAGATVNASFIHGGGFTGVAVQGSDMFVMNYGSDVLKEYTTGGVVVNAALVTGIDSPSGIAVSGSDVFVPNYQANTIAEYTTAGALVNSALISGITTPQGLAVSGSDLFVAYEGGDGGTIGEYTTSGAVINANLIRGLNNLYDPAGIAVSGSDLFVVNDVTYTVGEYTTSGATVNAALISGLQYPQGIAVSGSDLFVTNRGAGTIGEYTTSGAVVNASLVSGLALKGMEGIAVYGSDLFVVDQITNTIGEYTTSGATVNAALISGLWTPWGIAITGPLSAPTNVEAVPGNGQVSLSWDADGDATSYNIYRSTSSGGEGATPFLTNITGTSYVDMDVTNGTPYYYQVSAVDGAGEGALSDEVTAVPMPQSPTQLAFAQQPSNTVAGVAVGPAITVDVEDQFGNLVTTDSSDVTLAVDTGPGALGGTVTVEAVNGVATFNNAVLDTAGDYALTATDAALATAISDGFTIISAAASALVFGQQPSDATAGVANSPAIAVNVEDKFGNTVTTDTSTVTLAVASGPGAFGGTLAAQAVNGVATFNNAVLDTAGAYTLRATDAALTAATSDSFTINPAAAAQLVYAQGPSAVAVSSVISDPVVVQAEDQFGNTVTTDNADVTLQIASGPTGAALGGTVTVAAVNGVATFTNLSLNEPRIYKLRAIAGRLTATSSSFTVSTAASKLAFFRQPSNATAGVADSPAIIVYVEDKFGDVAVDDDSDVTLAVHSGPGAASGTLTVAAVDGVATFSGVVLDTAGSYTLRATDAALTAATSKSFKVISAAATQLVFGKQPSTATAGVVPSITVRVEDKFGNLVTTDDSDVTLTVATGPGALQGTLAVAAVHGVATFNKASLDTAGSYTLMAADGVLTAATSDAITVNPAGAHQLVFVQQPSDTTAGMAVSPAITVRVEDKFANTITGKTYHVTLKVKTGPGKPSGTLTVATVDGVATFGDIVLDTDGIYTLQASEGSLSAISDSFTIA